MNSTNKEEALRYIRMLAEQKIITRKELETAFGTGTEVNTDSTFTKRLGVSEILYYIGGAIVFFGISILIAIYWSSYNDLTKVLVTLGLGIAAYIVGVLFHKDKRTESASSAFFLISALVIPGGLAVVFDLAGLNLATFATQSDIFGILFLTYILSFVLFRKNILALFSILFGTGLFFSVTSFVLGDGLSFNRWQFYEYCILIAGLSYMLLGYAFTKTKLASLQGFLYGFGILAFLGSALSLCGWSPNQNMFWEIIYPGLVFGALFLSVHLKSNSFLTWGTIFLMIYILKITGEYFTGSLGWPVSLIVAGLLMIAAGQISLNLKKKYFSA